MIYIKGFAQHSWFKSNKPNEIYPIGELSNYSRTFTKDQGIYAWRDDEDITLYTFTSRDDTTYIELTSEHETNIRVIITDLYKKCIAARAGWTDNLVKYLADTYNLVAGSWVIGSIVKKDQYQMPEWVEWVALGQNTTIRIWFSDMSFRGGYDEYEIEVVPPIKNVDDFFKTRAEVIERVKQENDPISLADRKAVVRDSKPETHDPTRIFEWRDRLDPNFKLTTYWQVIIYGERGNNPDAIKNAITQYVLKHSIHDEEEWKQIFPDIFKRTEFIIVPRYDTYAIPTRTTISGIYSPVARYNDVVTTLKRFAHTGYGYTHNHIEEFATIMAHPYRSLQTLVISHPDNKDSYRYITDVYPDLLAEHSLSQDFNRMNYDTREFAEALMELIIEAESFTLYSTTPPKAFRVVRDGVVYISRTFNHVNFLVVAKVNFT